MTPADKSVIEWIRSAAIPLATIEPRHGFEDLKTLCSVIGDARIVSLGEATHGTREFFKLKHRILEFCVAELGFTMFGIEANFSESLAVNAYVLDGVGDAADALAGLRYWTWDTEEVLDLIKWMRWWNVNNPRKVKFYGFVMGSAAMATQRLSDYLARVAPELAAECKTELASLASDLTAQRFGQLSDARRAATFACITRVLAGFAERKTEWVTTTSALDWHLGRLHAIVLDGCARLSADPSPVFHDRAMAENVSALLEAEGPDAKAVLWAHNAHASRSAHQGDDSMGHHLDETFGHAQVVIGFAFDRGSFQARDYPSGVLADHHVDAAAIESFDGMLAQSGPPLFALDLANAPHHGAVAAWLASSMPARSIGGIYGLPKGNKYGVSYTQTIVPRRYYDVVVFVAESTPARGNRARTGDAAPVVLPAPSNLELGGDSVPVDWRIVRPERKYAYAIHLLEEHPESGRRTLLISRAAPWQWGHGAVTQKIFARAWHGRRVKFSAAIRTEVEDIGAGALIFIRFFAQPQQSNESNFYATEIASAACAEAPVRAPRWERFSVEADVPEAADSFMIGLAMTGNGAVWFADLEFTKVT
jgi:erythromycin esterase